MENTTEKYTVVDYCYQDFNNIELQNTNFLESIKKAHNPIVTIIHHTDMDGICAAQIMKEFCERCLNIYKIDLVAYNYSKDFNIADHISLSSNYVIAVDLSLKYTDWYKIFYIFDKEKYRKGLWLDHHIGSIREVYENENLFSDLPLEKYLDINGCGTMIAYELTKGFYTDEKFRTFGKLFNERTVFLTDCYDRWLQTKDKYWADCLNKYFYASEQMYVDSPVIKEVLFADNNKLNKALTNGNTYLQLDKERNHFRYNDFHQELTLHTPDKKEYKACVMWCKSGNSQIFGDHINDFDIVIRASYDIEKEEYYFSFYTVKDDVDCCEIARQYMGSGHAKAAGCMTSYNILNKKWKC